MGNCLGRKKWPDPSTVDTVPHKDKIINVFVSEVYDGDTCTVLIPFSKECLRLRIRIQNIDAPEVKVKIPKTRKESKTTTEYLEEKAGVVVRDYTRTLIDKKQVKAKLVKWDKYGGRVVGDVFFGKHHTPLSSHLLDLGYAKPYGGGKKDEWTTKELDRIVKNRTTQR